MQDGLSTFPLVCLHKVERQGRLHRQRQRTSDEGAPSTGVKCLVLTPFNCSYYMLAIQTVQDSALARQTRRC